MVLRISCPCNAWFKNRSYLHEKRHLINTVTKGIHKAFLEIVCSQKILVELADI